jgi:hypothetical protein
VVAIGGVTLSLTAVRVQARFAASGSVDPARRPEHNPEI